VKVKCFIHHYEYDYAVRTSTPLLVTLRLEPCLSYPSLDLSKPFEIDLPEKPKKPSEELNGLLSSGRVLTNAEWREALVAICNGLKAAGQ
jgi:hypothetical protein